MILHLRHILLTEALTFIFISDSLVPFWLGGLREH